MLKLKFFKVKFSYLLILLILSIPVISLAQNLDIVKQELKDKASYFCKGKFWDTFTPQLKNSARNNFKLSKDEEILYAYSTDDGWFGRDNSTHISQGTVITDDRLALIIDNKKPNDILYYFWRDFVSCEYKDMVLYFKSKEYGKEYKICLSSIVDTNSFQFSETNANMIANAFDSIIKAIIKAKQTEEANEFVNSFIKAVDSENIQDIQKCLEYGGIVEMFKLCNNDNIIKNPKSYAYLFIARGLENIGKRKEACEYYTRAIDYFIGQQNDELKSTIFAKRGYCLFCLRNLNDFEDENVKKAFEDFEEAIKLDSNNYDVILSKGWVYYHLDKKNLAIEEFKKAKSLCQDTDTKNKIQQDIDDINNKIQQDIDNIKQTEEANEFVNSFIKAVDSENIQDIQKCLEYGEDKIVEMFKLCNNDENILKNPKIIAYSTIADAYLYKDNYSNACKYYTESLSLFDEAENIDNKTKAHIFYYRSCSFFNMKNSNDLNDSNVQKALNDIEKAIEFDSKNYEIYLGRGQMYCIVGEKNMAIDDFKKAKSLCQDTDTQNKIQKDIDDINNKIQKDIDDKNIEIKKANKFINDFKKAIDSSNPSKIEKFLDKGEEEIVKMFKLCNNDENILKNPKIIAYSTIADAYLCKGNYSDACKYYTETLSRFDEAENIDNEIKVHIFLYRASSFFNMKNSNDLNDSNVQKALNDIEKAIEFDSKNYEIYLGRGQMYCIVGEKNMAIDDFKKAKSLCQDINTQNKIQKDIDDINMEIKKANKFINDFKKAINSSSPSRIEKFLDKGEEEIVKMFKISNCYNNVSKNPRTFAYMFIADAYFYKSNYSDACKYYTEAVSLFDEAENIDNKIKAHVFLYRASSFFNMKNSNDLNDSNVQEALNDIEKAIEFDSKNYEIYLGRGQIYCIVGEENMAIDDFNKAKSLCKNKNQKEKIQKQIDNLKKNKTIKKANDFVHGFEECLNNASDKHEIEKFLDKGEKEIIKMFKISNCYSDVSKNPITFAYIFIARAYQKLGSCYYAYQYYTKAISLNSNIDYSIKAGIYRDRAICMLEEAKENDNREKAQKAYNDIMKSIRLYNSDWYAYFIAGKINVIFGNRDKALEQFYKSKSLCDDSDTKNNIQKNWIAGLESDKRWEGLFEMGKTFLKGLKGGLEIGASIVGAGASIVRDVNEMNEIINE